MNHLFFRSKNIIRKSLNNRFYSNFNESQILLKETVRKLSDDLIYPQSLEYNRDEKFNKDLFKYFGELGLFGVTIPEKYGGSEMDVTSSCIVHEELSSYDPGLCLSYMVHSILFCNNLYVNGNIKQWEKYLPDACSGNLIGSMCMSEPHAGTDVLSMKTYATEKEDHYLLNGRKMWITNGCIDDNTLCDVSLVYAKTGENRKDISLFILEKDMNGFELGQRIKNKCGMRSSTSAELVFDNVMVPKENLVGEKNKALLCMMKNLEIERLCLAAMSVGMARKSIEIMNNYSKERKAFNKNLNEFGQIQSYLANSYSEYSACKSYLYNIANNYDINNINSTRIDTDSIKLVSSKMATNVCDRAIQTLGGNGYCGEYIVERLWRDSRLIQIGGGTNESHEKNITKDLENIDII